MAWPIPAADVMLTIVHEGKPMDLLEVWGRSIALGSDSISEESANTRKAHFRARVPPFLGNSRLVAVGGRRVILLDPQECMSSGQLRVLEWRPQASSVDNVPIPKRSSRMQTAGCT